MNNFLRCITITIESDKNLTDENFIKIMNIWMRLNRYTKIYKGETPDNKSYINIIKEKKKEFLILYFKKYFIENVSINVFEELQFKQYDSLDTFDELCRRRFGPISDLFDYNVIEYFDIIMQGGSVIFKQFEVIIL